MTCLFKAIFVGDSFKISSKVRTKISSWLSLFDYGIGGRNTNAEGCTLIDYAKAFDKGWHKDLFELLGKLYSPVLQNMDSLKGFSLL